MGMRGKQGCISIIWYNVGMSKIKAARAACVRAGVCEKSSSRLEDVSRNCDSHVSVLGGAIKQWQERPAFASPRRAVTQRLTFAQRIAVCRCTDARPYITLTRGVVRGYAQHAHCRPSGLPLRSIALTSTYPCALHLGKDANVEGRADAESRSARATR